ncbi:Alpha/Beta hydrolase protein [Chytriomyces sp. MP71]|nr:Alpha/Beta hydrolase protein [Chytriomyces sp. MP71]
MSEESGKRKSVEEWWNKGDYVVQSMPGISKPDFEALGEMHAGLIPTAKDGSDTDGSLFFWMINAKSQQPTPKIVFWLNGGPGCSSMDGLFLENGPFIPFSDGTVKVRESGWWLDATVVYVDQPVGTGYSTPGKSGYARSLKQVAEMFRGFIERYFTMFPELSTADLYIAGESYAGQYIPYIANNLLTVAGDANSISPKLKYKGLMIGNGWMDPKRQYLSTLSYSVDHHILSGNFLKKAEKSHSQCLAAVNEGTEKVKVGQCDSIMNHVLSESSASGKNCINMYDIRLYDEDPSDGCGLFAWPPHVKDMKYYLGKAAVKSAVHVPNNGQDTWWEECDGSVNSGLTSVEDPPSYTLFPSLLEKVPVLLFNGDMDLICNWYGVRDMVEAMEWNGAKGMQNAPKQDWYLNNKLEGWYQTSRNLTFVLKYNASHMVPVDSPFASTDMFNRFVGAVDPVVTAGTLVAQGAGLPVGGEKDATLPSTAVATSTTTTVVELFTSASTPSFLSAVKPTDVVSTTATAADADADKHLPSPGDLDEIIDTTGSMGVVKEDSGTLGRAVLFFIVILFVMTGCYFLLSKKSRGRRSGWGLFRTAGMTRSGSKAGHEWMELDAQENISTIDDEEFDEMLDLDNAGPSRKRVGTSQV